jgi:hypothetical protein
MGAKIIFSKTLEGQPFLTESEESIKFVYQMSEKQKFNLKFKVPAMTYGGKLEY